MIKHALLGLAAVSVIALPLAAAARTTASDSSVAAKLASVGERKGTAVRKGQKLDSGSTVLLVAGGVAAGVGLYFLVDGNGDESNGAS